jgi:hypothetical protein
VLKQKPEAEQLGAQMNTFASPDITAILIGLAILLIVFLLIREVLCWYWKINKAISLLTEIRDLLKQSGANPMPRSTRSALSAESSQSEHRDPTLY